MYPLTGLARSREWNTRHSPKTVRSLARYNSNMVDPTQTLLTVGIPTLAVLIGILVNNSRLNDFRAHMDSRFNSFDSRMDACLSRIGQELHLK